MRKKKLSLKKDTLRRLSAVDLEKAAGGTGYCAGTLDTCLSCPSAGIPRNMTQTCGISWCLCDSQFCNKW